MKSLVIFILVLVMAGCAASSNQFRVDADKLYRIGEFELASEKFKLALECENSADAFFGLGSSKWKLYLQNRGLDKETEKKALKYRDESRDAFLNAIKQLHAEQALLAKKYRKAVLASEKEKAESAKLEGRGLADLNGMALLMLGNVRLQEKKFLLAASHFMEAEKLKNKDLKAMEGFARAMDGIKGAEMDARDAWTRYLEHAKVMQVKEERLDVARGRIINLNAILIKVAQDR